MRRARSLPKRLNVRKALMLLHQRVEKLEKMHETRSIGFQTEVRGDVIEQDEDEFEIEEIP